MRNDEKAIGAVLARLAAGEMSLTDAYQEVQRRLNNCKRDAALEELQRSVKLCRKMCRVNPNSVMSAGVTGVEIALGERIQEISKEVRQ